MDPYPLVKFVHVLLAIVAVGFNASYGIWLGRAASASERGHLPHVLRGIKILDDRFANPAYALLLVTGLVMVFIGPWDLTTFWIAAALVLYVVAVLVGFLVYTPTLRRQIAVLDTAGAESAEYRSVAGRGQVTGIALAVIVVAIVFLMVVKPGA